MQADSAQWKAENELFKKDLTVPPLKHGWKLNALRFPLVPYWCLTMKMGKDHDCYGRLTYDLPHGTVHSYHKPHWHKSLKPYENQYVPDLGFKVSRVKGLGLEPGVCVSLILLANNCSNNVRELFA